MHLEIQHNGMDLENYFLKKIDGVIFTSASSVRGFFEIMHKDYEKSDLIRSLKIISSINWSIYI